MDPAFLVALAVVACVGLPAALVNWTARALVANYAIVTGVWLATREAPLTSEQALQIAVIADYLVLVVIFIKPADEGEPTPGALGWARDWWLGRSWWDKAVVCLFLPSWISYSVTLPPDWAFWPAWTAGVLQLFAAGGEALEGWRRGRAQAETDDPTDLPMRRQGLAVNEC